jgi:hypothetical protein
MTTYDNLSDEGKETIARASRFMSGVLSIREVTAMDGQPFLPLVGVWRHGEDKPCAVALTPGNALIDSSDMLTTYLSIFVRGFDGDMVAVAFDTFQSTSNVNPATGEPWNRNEMGIAFAMGNTYDAVAESIVVYISHSDGSGAMSTARYRRAPGGMIEWLTPNLALGEVMHRDVGASYGGQMIDKIESVWQGEAFVAASDQREFADQLLANFLTAVGWVVHSGDWMDSE